MAKRQGYRQIDHDANITRDGVVVICHWPTFAKDGFRYIVTADGKYRRHAYPRNAQIRDLNWAEVRKLRTKDGYRIRDARTMFRNAARIGLEVALEVKGDSRFEDQALMRDLHKTATEEGCVVRVMTLSNIGTHPNLRLKAAREAGFETVLLARGPVPTGWEPAISFVRGKWKRAV